MFFFRLREKFKHEHVEDCLKQLLKNEKMSSNDLKEWQLDKMKDFVGYVREHVPYYRQIKSVRDASLDDYKTAYDMLSLFPIIDKQTITANFENWFSDTVDRLNVSIVRTSGSTGTPFRFYMSPEGSWYKAASKYRLYNRFGIKPDERQICLSCDKKDEKLPLMTKIKLMFHTRFVDKRFYSNVTYLDDTEIRKQIKKIGKLKPASIWGYPSAIYEICRWALENKVEINPKGFIKAVVFSGEGHTSRMKEVVSKAMGGCPVIDEYNSSESFLAASCKESKLHLNEDTTLFEVILPDGAISEYGKGELLITCFFSKEFPIIRYKVGDVVEIVEETCPCGLIGKVLKSVDGRSAAKIYNGAQVMPHTAVSHYMHYSEFEDDIIKMQVEQNELSSVIVRTELKSDNLDKIRFESMWRNIFNQIKVNFEYVNFIPREPSGKFRDVIQNVKG